MPARRRLDQRLGAGIAASYAEGSADADHGLQRLIDWAKARQRPTVIAFFGDHLPPLGPVYVETGFLKDMSRRARRRPPKPRSSTTTHRWSSG